MSQDIHSVLREWRFRPDAVTARTIQGDDGKEKVQLRLDLGVLQMEVNGRPDGRRFGEHDSLLEVHETEAREHDGDHPDGPPYPLGPEACGELIREAVQYYHRYVSFWALDRYELCARDTARNQRMIRFVLEHATRERDRAQVDQWRPYVAMMHTRAVATPLERLNQYDAAVSAIEAGMREIRDYLIDHDQEERAEDLSELVFLRRWRRTLREKAGAEADEPAVVDPIDAVRARLAEAVEAERYEDAADLRDELRRLEDPPSPM